MSAQQTRWIVSTMLLVVAAIGCPSVDPKLTCTSDADCHEYYACDLTDTMICLRSCEDDTECLASQACDTGDGVCRYPTTSDSTTSEGS